MKVLDIVFLTVFVIGVSCHENNSNVENNQSNEVTDEGNMRVIYKLLMDCTQKGDISVCLKLKAVNVLDRALAMKAPLPLMDYVALARDASAPEVGVGSPMSEDELEATLPRSLDEKSGRLDQMLMDKVDQLIRSRTLQFTMPSDLFEGRRKGGKMGGLVLAAGAAMAGMMMQLAMGKIALIAGKALIVAKVALVLSAVIGLKKLLSGGHGGGDSHPQVVYATAEHGGGWQHRSLNTNPLDNPAHEMAYSAHVNGVGEVN